MVINMTNKMLRCKMILTIGLNGCHTKCHMTCNVYHESMNTVKH